MIALIIVLLILILYIIVGIIVVSVSLTKNKKLATKYMGDIKEKVYLYKAKKPINQSVMLIENTEVNGFGILPLVEHLNNEGYDVYLFNQRWVSFSPNIARDFLLEYIEENHLNNLILISFGTAAILHADLLDKNSQFFIKNVYLSPVQTDYLSLNISRFVKVVFYLIAKAMLAIFARSDVHVLNFHKESKKTLIMWSCKDKIYMNYLIVPGTQYKASQNVKYIGYSNHGYHLFFNPDKSLVKDRVLRESLKGKNVPETLEIPFINDEFSEDLLTFLKK